MRLGSVALSALQDIVQLLYVLKELAGAVYHAVKRALGDVYGYAGLLEDEPVKTS